MTASCAISHHRVEGFDALTAETGPLALTLIPALGGKISSLRDARSGREWLWRHPRLPYRRLPHGSSYVRDADTGGWDECFPSVSACAYPSPPWPGAAIQDHGELWSQPAELTVDEGGGAVWLGTAWPGVALPYRFERTLRLSAGSAAILCQYRVTNLGDAPLDWIWSAHPLIAIEPGMRVELPPGHYHRNIARPAGLGAAPLDPLPGPESRVALKIWSHPLAEGWARVTAADGALHMRWDARELPQAALWMNLGNDAGDGGAPFYNMGLEPCIGAQDSLADAVTEHKIYASLGPGESRSWRLEVELVAPAAEP